MLFDLLNIRDWLYHYEVVITRQGRDQLLARVPTRRYAELAIANAPAKVEVSRQTIQWRRARGVHPDKVAVLCTLLLLVMSALPWAWPSLIFSVVCVALIGGLLTSGRDWRQGGDDDR